MENITRQAMIKINKRKKINFFSKDKESIFSFLYDCFFLIVIALSLVTAISPYEIKDGNIIYNSSIVQSLYDYDIVFLAIFAFDFFVR